MREILFRGKRTKNGDWAIGNLWHHNDKASAIYSNDLDRLVWVSTETVGQYTGLTDKNGKRIFEGNILRSRYDDMYPDDVTIEVVKWFRNGWYIQQEDCIPDLLEEDGVLPDSEIIGNIHDNQELLEAPHG